MAHTTSTAPAHISTIEAVGPSGPGALAGYEVRCADCAFVARTSLPTIARQDAYDHAAWAAKQPVRPTREQRIEQMVADGWSREFAEAYLPMTVAQARREGLTGGRYVSELSLLAGGRKARGR